MTKFYSNYTFHGILSEKKEKPTESSQITKSVNLFIVCHYARCVNLTSGLAFHLREGYESPYSHSKLGVSMLNREQALALLQEWHPEPHLVQHALASEAVMRGLAVQLGEDEELWGLTGLLHDLDYPLTHDKPEQHGLLGAERLEGLLPEPALHAIRAHNGEMTGVLPESTFDFALRCGETVTGLVVTAALVRPSGMEGMQVSSLKKKMKDKAFAASVNRDCIRQCVQAGVDLDTFLALAIRSMSAIDAELGLRKTA